VSSASVRTMSISRTAALLSLFVTTPTCHPPHQKQNRYHPQPTPRHGPSRRHDRTNYGPPLRPLRVTIIILTIYHNIIPTTRYPRSAQPSTRIIYTVHSEHTHTHTYTILLLSYLSCIKILCYIYIYICISYIVY